MTHLLLQEKIAFIAKTLKVLKDILKTHYHHLSKSYYESFIDLKMLDIFSENERRELASTAGFRNRLAHDYLELHPDITIKSLEKILKIYPNYLKKIKQCIDKK